MGFALAVLNVCFTKGEFFFQEAGERNFGILLLGVMPRRYEKQLRKGDTEIDEMGSSKVFGCFCCTKVIKITYQ